MFVQDEAGELAFHPLPTLTNADVADILTRFVIPEGVRIARTRRASCPTAGIPSTARVVGSSHTLAHSAATSALKSSSWQPSERLSTASVTSGSARQSSPPSKTASPHIGADGSLKGPVGALAAAV